MLIYQGYKIFLMEKDVSCSPVTVDYYRLSLTKFLEYLAEVGQTDYKNLDYTVLNRDSVTAYMAFLRSRVQYPGNDYVRVDKRLKNTSVNTYVRAIKAFVNWSYDEGFLPDNFSKKIKMPRNDEEQVIPLYQQEVDKIDTFFSTDCETGLRNYCVFHVMLDCGLRAGEVIRLDLTDVDFDKNYIVVRGKGGKQRIVPLPPKLKVYLYRYAVYYRSYMDDCVTGVTTSTFFTQVKRQLPLTDSVVRRIFLTLKKQSGVERVYPHLLRHTFATSYVMGGGNLEFLRILMGHYDYTVTRKYLHLASQYTVMGAEIYQLDPVYFKTAY